MATKTKTPKRKKSKSLASGGARKGVRRRKRKGGLSELFNPTVAMNSAKSTLAASAGGMGAVFFNKMVPATWGKLPRVALGFGLGFLATSFGMGSTGAGFTGGTMALTFQNGFMNEDADFAEEESLSDMPLFLDEEGNPMVLEEGENGEAAYRYLSEAEIQTLNEEV